MYGIVIDVHVDPAREDEARRMLTEMIVPMARAHAGFSGGYWLRSLSGDLLRTVQLYDSEDHARAAGEEIGLQGPPPNAPVALDSIETYEVIAQA